MQATRPVAQSNVITITGDVTDSTGAVGHYHVDVTMSDPSVVTINSATVTPDPAPPNTKRTLTINATSSTNSPLTYATPVAAGVTFTPVAGQPNQFTFTV